MPRIFKGSGSTLRLLIHKCVDYSTLSNLKVVLYTTDPEIAVQVNEGIVVEGNKVIFTLPSTAFAYMDDGVINYIIEGFVNNDFFSTERQSDYYLKTPTSYIAEGGSYQEKYLNIHANGLYEVVPDEGKDAMTKVSVNVDVQPNLGQLNADFVDYDGEGNYWRYGFDDGFDGFNYIKINASAYGEQKRNEGYGQGHSDGIIEGVEVGKIQAGAEAITLDATENGTYYTKYADIPEFNEPLTGDDFYSYVKVSYACFDTGVRFNELTDLEFWYRFTDDFGTTGTFFGYNNSTSFTIERDSDSYATDEGYRFIIKWGDIRYYVYLKKDEWHNFKWSENNFSVDGTMVSYFQNNLTSDKTIWFNGNTEGSYNNQKSGEYGMVKINGRVIVPDGYSFKWRDTDEFLPFVSDLGKSGSNYFYTFEKVETPVIIDGLIKEVNIETKVDVGGLNLLPMVDTKMPKIPYNFDFSNVKNFSYAFSGSGKLTDISALRSATNPIYVIENMFSSSNLAFDLSPLEDWNVDECVSANFCFSNSQFTDYSPLAKWNLSKCTNMSSFIQINVYRTPDIIKIPAIRCDSVGSLSQGIVRFSASSAKCPVIEMGGFVNIKTSLTQSDGISMCPNLTYESCINILNGLYDFTGNGETPTSTQGTLKVNQAFLDLVGDEITIGTNKGWTITA